MADTAPLFSHYNQLLAKANAHWERVTERHGEHMQCKLGCTACCQQDLHVSPIEAAQIRRHLTVNPPPPHDGSRTPADAHPLFEYLAHGQPCVFLAKGGGCGIYEARPLICRTHGVPVLAEEEVDVCPLNFAGDEVELEQSDVLNLATLNTMLGMINQLYVQAGHEDVRVPLSILRAEAEVSA